MPLEDFTNWTPETCKRVIHEYQQTRDEKLFSLLLAKYDKYIVGLAWKYQRQAHGVPLEDLYHSAIIGFSNAMIQFKPQAPARLIIAVIKAYVRREIESKYISKKPEDIRGLPRLQQEPLDSDIALDAYFILNSSYLSKEDKELLALRFEQGMTLKEVSTHLGVGTQKVWRKLQKILNTIRRELENENT